MLRAEYVFIERSHWYAVFAKGIQPNQLNGIVERLKALPGITAQALTKDQHGTPRTVIEMGGRVPFSTVKLLKQITDPILHITINSLTLVFVLCPCGHKSIVGDIRFLNGFEPKNAEAFRREFIKKLTACDLFPLWETKPQPLSEGIVTRATKVLVELKAIMEEMTLRSSKDPKLCELKRVHQLR